jgi:hypothetical protein
MEGRFAVDGYTLDHRTGRAQVEAQELFHGPEDEVSMDAIHSESGLPLHTENLTDNMHKEQ